MASKEEEQLKNELKARIDAENDNTEALRKARAVIEEQLKTTAELNSTTATINAALAEYMRELKAAHKTTRRAKEAFDEEAIALDRLKKSLGDVSKSLLGTIAIAGQEISVAKKKVALYTSELNVAKEALAIKTKLKNDLKQEIKETSDAINASRARSEALEASRKLLLAERDAFAPSMAASEARTEALEASRQRLLAERDAFAPSMAASEARTEALEAIRPLLLEEAAALQDKIKVQTEAAEASKKASKQNINRLMSMDASYASEISEINKALTVLRTKNRTGKKLSDVEQSRIAELEAMKAAAQSNRAKNQAIVDSEIASRQQNTAEIDALVRRQQQLASELDKNAESLAKESFDRLDLTNRYSVVGSELEKNAEALAKESFDRLDLTNRFPVLESEIEKNAEALAKESFDRMDLTDIMKNQLFPEYMAAVKAEKDLKKAVNDRTDKLNTAKDELTNLKVSAAAKIMTKVAEGMKKLAEAIDKLVTMIRELQQSFGITAGQAAKLKFDNLVSSVKSYTASILTLGKVVPVSIKEIEAAQKAFQDEFGGVITTRAATQLASEAKRMGVTTEQLAKARRVFMTSSMGDVGAANAAQNKFIAEFQKKGLTSKDAMLAIGQNSELLARNGSRFAVSFARAAADAKKIGVDLGKIDQVGDNIIGDFEGFLEKQAELGAMGFGFDTSRLAEVAETGDTGALMNELRSQLAATGKDITKLRRSEQLALSSAFGISMEELQRLAAPPGTEGSGEQLTDQQQANKFLERITNLLEGAKFALMGISITLGIIAARMLVFSKIPTLFSSIAPMFSKLLAPVTAIIGRITALISKIPGIGNLALKTPGAMLRPFAGAGTTGVLAGITGAISGFMTARKEGRSGTSSAGRGYVQGAAAAAGAVAGQALIPIPVVGALIGGFLGNVIGKGLNKMIPELGEGIGIAFKKVLAFFEPVKQAFARIGDSFKPLIDAFSKLSNVFNVEGREASKVAEVIGSALAFFLKVGLLPLNLALQIIAGSIKFVIDGFTVLTNIVTALLSLFTFDAEKIKESFGNLGTSILEMVGGVITNTFSLFSTTIVAFFGDIGTSVMSSLSGILSKIPFIGKFFATGDDVISRSGYGQQTLVTPRGSVALNNRDTVVAYADDFTSSIMGGMQFFKKGALTNVLQSLPEMMKSMSLLTPLTMPLAPVMNTLTGTPAAPTAPALNLLPFLRGTAAQQTPPTTAAPAISVDMSTLERKLDQVIGAISSMEVSMDGNKVGKVIAGSEQRASTTGVFRALR